MKKIIIPFIFLFSIFLGFYYIYSNNLPVSKDTKKKDFIIGQGESVENIAKRLKNASLIRDPYTFIFYTLKLGVNSKIQSGKFRISPSLSTREIALEVSKAGSSDYWLKIIDGQRVEEITPKFDKKYEGKLFPDSYLIPDYYDNDEILSVILENFDKKFSQAKVDATNTKMSDEEIIIFASLLEREARTLESKQMVAGILLNRYSIGMGLQVDASIQYARDTINKPAKYWEPVSKEDLKIVSPYNTYKNRGLPPTPICSPGYNSIFAAFHPIDSDYMYYITGNDNKMHYAKTLSEHNANINKYLH